jgi:hypothetical protein
MTNEENLNVNIEQILAAILKTVKKINVTVEDLVADYGDYSVAIDQEEDGTLTFKLVENESR